MWAVLLVFCLITQSLSYNNGWVPLTLDEVLSRSAPRYDTASHIPDQLWSSRTHTNDDEFARRSVINIKQYKIQQLPSEENNFQNFEKSGGRAIDTNSASCQSKHSEPFTENPKSNLEEHSESSNNLEIIFNQKARQAKQINNKSKIISKDILKFNITRDYNKITSRDNKYEVNEPTDEKDQIKSEQIFVQQTPGYIYNTPADVINDANNITNKFLSILTKYKLNLKEEDTNYALSRINPSKFSRDKFYLVTLPIKVPQGYNTQNHESVNPILAMLLSNYGVYVPGMFGTVNKYRNLYGYLASNNIHNNRPFGLYKIFSDTDSSN